jgi:hypothetical protein
MNNLKQYLQNIHSQKVLNNKLNSTIVTKKEIKFILNYININENSNAKYYSFDSLNLLFRGSENGDNTELLHEKCDLKNNIIILIKSDIGKIFGGYCKIGFKSQDKAEYKMDNYCFLFSVDLKKIYPVIEDKKPICYIGSCYGLCFYNCLVFYNNFMEKKDGIVCSKKNNYFNGILDDYEMNAGVKNFKCEELEIFQLK